MQKVLLEKEFTVGNHNVLYCLVEGHNSYFITCEVDYLLDYDCTGEYIGLSGFMDTTIFEISYDVSINVDDGACGYSEMFITQYLDPSEIRDIAFDVFNKITKE